MMIVSTSFHIYVRLQHTIRRHLPNYCSTLTLRMKVIFQPWTNGSMLFDDLHDRSGIEKGETPGFLQVVRMESTVGLSNFWQTYL